MTTSAAEHRTASAAYSASVLRDEPERLERVFARVGERVSAAAVPAAAVAVGDAEGLIGRATFSSAVRPLDADSNFFLASVTKPIIATAFMQLVQAGLIGLHQPIADFEPRMRGGGRERVTPWHVLTHTSGLADLEVSMIARKRPNAAHMTRLVLESPVRFEPGTRWQYCSASFYLLTSLMERLSGMPYVRFLDERLIRPLGMRATFDPRRAGRPIVAVHGIGVDSWWKRRLVLRYMARAALPGGGLFGTLDDLGRFGAAVLRPPVIDGRPVPLRSDTLALMGEDHTRGLIGEDDGEIRPIHHGLGWGKPTLMRHGDAPGSERVVSHGGASGTRLWIDPDAGLVFVFFTNQWSADRATENEALAGTYAAMSA